MVKRLKYPIRSVWDIFTCWNTPINWPPSGGSPRVSAHEINNPLAIINEKAGLVKDYFTYKSEYKSDPKLIQIIDAITSSVARCSRITRRLLRFARHIDVSIQSINIKEVIQEVLGFMEKEAEYRSIDVDNQVPR